MGIAFINSREVGNMPSQFNQFQSINLSNAQYINQHVLLLDKIKVEMSELAGVSPQRQGQVSSSELVGTTERAIMQSSHITELWFFHHNEVKQRCLEALLDVAKIAWRDGKHINYIMDDMSRIFMKIEGDTFDDSQFGVFVSDAGKDLQTIEFLKTLIQPAMQNGASLQDAITIMTNTSIAGMKNAIKETEEKYQQRQAEAERQRQEGARTIEELKLQAEREKEDREDARNTEDNQTKIDVALINANSRADSEGGPEGDQGLEREKFSHQRDKDNKESSRKDKELDNKLKD
jgi:vacuolar-type H+-ATPase subunit I/STV1